MDYKEIDLSQCPFFLRKKWSVQNDKQDYDTGFIYYCKTIDQIIDLAKCNNVDETYAVHRWYNYVCSKACEEMFCECGAVAEKNLKSKYADIYIKDIPFDVKLSVMPKNYDKPIYTRQEKNDLINWLVQNQSNGIRFNNNNKIYIIINKGINGANNFGKSKFDEIKPRISAFMEYYKNRDFNSVEINGEKILAEIIVVE